MNRDPVDDEVLREAAEGGGIPLTPEVWKEITEAAKEVSDFFHDKMQDYMTPARAAWVRQLRVDRDYTWRAVAAACHTEWNGDWMPPSNQLMGMEICDAAARHFGEDYMTGDWN